MANKEKFIITEEMIQKAESYIPLARKRAIAKAVAEACLEAADALTEEISRDTQLSIPQLHREQCGTKALHLMYFFLTEYLHLDLSDDFAEDEYDYYASSHIFNQLERFKSGDMELRIKVFDILYDYKALKSMLETEIYNLKETKNSALDRLQSSLALFSTPENIAKLNELLQKTIAETEEAQNKLAEKRGEAKAEIKPTEE